jgi:Uma2 family endonuclease
MWQISPPRDQLIRDPVLIVEVLSPTTAFYDRQVNVANYRRITSVEEILLIDSASIFAEVLRREGNRWIIEIGHEATLSLASIGLSVALANLYEGIHLIGA